MSYKGNKERFHIFTSIKEWEQLKEFALKHGYIMLYTYGTDNHDSRKGFRKTWVRACLLHKETLNERRAYINTKGKWVWA